MIYANTTTTITNPETLNYYNTQVDRIAIKILNESYNEEFLLNDGKIVGIIRPGSGL